MSQSAFQKRLYTVVAGGAFVLMIPVWVFVKGGLSPRGFALAVLLWWIAMFRCPAWPPRSGSHRSACELWRGVNWVCRWRAGGCGRGCDAPPRHFRTVSRWPMRRSRPASPTRRTSPAGSAAATGSLPVPTAAQLWIAVKSLAPRAGGQGLNGQGKAPDFGGAGSAGGAGQVVDGYAAHGLGREVCGHPRRDLRGRA